MEEKNEFNSSKFVHPPDDDLVCAICLNVAQDAVETKCVHIFCEACISGWMNKSKTCPVDRQKINPKDVVPSRFARKKILNLMMKCECGKTHSVRDFENHQKKCKNRKKKCDTCNVFVKEGLFEAHIADQLGKHHDALLKENQRFKHKMKELRTEFEDQRNKAKEAKKKFQSYRKKTDASMTSLLEKLDLLQKKVALLENESKSHEIDGPPGIHKLDPSELSKLRCVFENPGGKQMAFRDDCTVVRKLSDSPDASIVLGDSVVKSDSMYFEINVCLMHDEMWIGLTNDTEVRNIEGVAIVNHPNIWAYCDGHGHSTFQFGGASDAVKREDRYETGDTIGMLVDPMRNLLKFFKNGKMKKTTHLPSGELERFYVFVMLDAKDDVVEIVSPEKWKYGDIAATYLYIQNM